MHCLREFDEAYIEMKPFSPKQINRIKAILVFKGLTIKSISFLKPVDEYEDENFTLSQFALTAWLNLMPNLERIAFYGNWSQDVGEIYDGVNVQLNLPKLKNVKWPPNGLEQKLHHSRAASLEYIMFCSPKALPNLNDIFRVHRDTLTELRFEDFFLYNDATPFHQLQLHTLSFSMEALHFWLNRSVVEIIDHQFNLRKLCLGQIGSNHCIFVTAPMLTSICNLKNLESLEFGKN